MSLVGKLEYGLSATKDALGKAKAADKEGERLLGFVRDYYNDAQHYAGKDAPTALEAVAYAHGILDGGVLAGHIKIKGYHLEAK